MKNILLIGGAGYVGTVLTSHFLKKGHKVTVIDNFTYDNQFAIQPYLGDPDYRFVYGDMGDRQALSDAADGATDVVLLAGLVGDPITKKYPEASEAVNVRSIQRTIDFFDSRNIDKLLFISTCSNYGMIGEDKLAGEDYPLNPLSHYARAKVANEHYLLDKRDKVDYTAVVLRFSTAFGLSPRMRFDLTVNEFVRDFFMGKELLVYDEHTWRPYCHLRDFARLLNLVLEADNGKVHFEVFNAGGDINNYTKKMIVDAIQDHIPDGKVTYGQNGSDPRNYRVSFARVRQVLGFEPEFTLQNGVTELITALKHGVFADSIQNRENYGNYTIRGESRPSGQKKTSGQKRPSGQKKTSGQKKPGE